MWGDILYRKDESLRNQMPGLVYHNSEMRGLLQGLVGMAADSSSPPVWTIIEVP